MPTHPPRPPRETMLVGPLGSDGWACKMPNINTHTANRDHLPQTVNMGHLSVPTHPHETMLVGPLGSDGWASGML